MNAICKCDKKKLTYCGLFFVKNLVVLRHGNTEDYRSYVFKTVNPFFPFGSLASNIKQPVMIYYVMQDSKANIDLLKIEVFEWEVDLYDPCGFHSRPEDILFCRLVVLGSQPVQVVKETEIISLNQVC